MPPDSPYPDWTGTPPFVRSFLHTLNQMRARETLLPEQLTERARALLTDRLDPSPEPIEAAFAHEPLGIIAEHTRYFDGFAVMMPLAQGTAVAVRSGASARLIMESSREVWSLASAPASEAPLPVRLVHAVLQRMVSNTALEVAVVHTAPSDGDALAALGMATARAVQALAATTHTPADLIRLVHQAIAFCLDGPSSIAYVIAAEAERPVTDRLLLIDTGEQEFITIEGASDEAVGWGVVHLSATAQRPASFHQKRKSQAEAALAGLRARGFPHLDSLRDLEHRELQSALGVLLRPSHRAIVRYLVAENARVQKLVAAIRRRDWQMLGALLLMSHAAQKNDLGLTRAEADFLVEQAEAMSIDGIYGACATGGGRDVLVVGQPFAVPQHLERMRTAFEERFNKKPDATLV